MRGLETPRLWLKPLELEDAEQAQPLFARWEVVRFLNGKVPWPFPKEGVRAYYRDVALPAMARGEEWHWTLRLKAKPAQLIGAIGLMRSGLRRSGGGVPGRNEEAEGVNRGFWLAPEWSGRGLMTEAVIAANDFWFEELGFTVLRTSKAIENIGSRRISEKTGMRVVGTGVSGYVSGRFPSETWEIKAEEWRSWRKRAD